MSSFLTDQFDGVIRKVNNLRSRYLGYKFLVLNDNGETTIIPVKHGDLTLAVRNSLNTMVLVGFLPEIHKTVAVENVDEVNLMIILHFLRFMAAVIREKNPRVVDMGKYTFDRAKQFRSLDWEPGIYIVDVVPPNILNFYASSFNGQRLETLF